MQGEFEKDIQKRMQDFNLEPSPQVWSEIDAALGEKKRRRFVIWWWLLPLMLAGGSIVWLYDASYKSYTSSIVDNKKEEAGEKNNESIIKENKSEAIQENVGTKKHSDAANSKQHEGKLNEDEQSLNVSTIKNKSAVDEKKINNTNVETTSANKIAEPSEVKIDNTNKVIEPSEVDKKIIQQNRESIISIEKKTDSSKNEFALSLNKRESPAFQFPLKGSTVKFVQKIKKEKQ